MDFLSGLEPGVGDRDPRPGGGSFSAASDRGPMTELVPVLVTGGRELTDRVLVRRCLVAVHLELTIPTAEIVVVHGGQGTIDREGRVVKGCDLIAGEEADELGMQVDPRPADWDTCGPECNPAHRRPKKIGRGTYCPTAGYRRNQEMVDLYLRRYYCCLGFPVGASRGTRDCMRRAGLAGIRVVNCTEVAGAKVKAGR